MEADCTPTNETKKAVNWKIGLKKMENTPLVSSKFSHSIDVRRCTTGFGGASNDHSWICSFSIRNFNTLESLISFTQTKIDYIVVERFYLEKVCEQFAHNQNIDILISI